MNRFKRFVSLDGAKRVFFVYLALSSQYVFLEIKSGENLYAEIQV